VKEKKERGLPARSEQESGHRSTDVSSASLKESGQDARAPLRAPFLAVLLLIALTLIAHAADAPKPNIVFILMDNLGYGEVGCYGGGIVRGAATPFSSPNVHGGRRNQLPAV
jgi:hypothetical protein